MTDKDQDYYRLRASQESAAAVAASCERVRAIHCQLAELYAAKLRPGAGGVTEATAQQPASASNVIIIDPLARRAG